MARIADEASCRGEDAALTFRYRALGLDLVAPFLCSGFWPVSGPTTGREITIDLGPVPARLADPVCDRPLLQVDAAGTALHHVPGVARYLMRERSRITMALEPAATLARALDFLKGTPLALLCRQWGLVPLDGACLALAGRALVLGAPAGCGKSTLALALAAHGYRLMGDGLCALEAPVGRAPMVWPCCPEVKLWRDSLEALGSPLASEPPTPGGRYTLSAETWFDPEPRPVMALAALRSASGGVAERVARLRGAAAFTAAMNLQSLSDAMRGRPGGSAPMQAIARLVDYAPVYDVCYPGAIARAAALPAWLIAGLALPDAAADQAGATCA